MVSIANILEPAGANLLIARDKESEVVGTGANGDLVAPDGYRDRSRPSTGLVVKTGPQASYAPGTWVIFDSFSGTELAMGGDRDKLLLASEQVLAYRPADVVAAHRKIVGELAMNITDPLVVNTLLAPLGTVLVERAEMPTHRGRIIIPDGVNVTTRSSEAEVISSGVPQYESGEQVFLAGSVSKSFNCGPGYKRRLWRCTPAQIPARILESPDEAIVPETDPRAGMKELQEHADHEPTLPEGDPRLPR